MEPVAPPLVKLTPSQIAKDWTARGAPVTRQYVDKLMRKGVGGQKLEGQHVASLDAAWQWRTERTRVFVSPPGGGGASGSDGKKGNAPAGAFGNSNPNDHGGASIEAMLDRVKAAEVMAFGAWQRELLSIPSDAMRTAAARREYNDAANVRIDVEKRVSSYKKEIGQAVDLETAQQMIDDRLGPFRSALNGLDRELAQTLHPEDPARHRRAIRSALSRVLLPAIANAKKRLRPTPPPAHGQPRVAA